MATSSFIRKIIVTGKEATDIIIDALTSDEKEKKDIYKTEDFLAENSKRGREALKRFVSLYKK